MSISHKYSGNAYENDNIDGRADISNPAIRKQLAGLVSSKRRPWNMAKEEYDALCAWGDEIKNGIDLMPPYAISKIFSIRWPCDTVKNNGQRAEESSK